jgi:hypothetical protein
MLAMQKVVGSNPFSRFDSGSLTVCGAFWLAGGGVWVV